MENNPTTHPNPNSHTNPTPNLSPNPDPSPKLNANPASDSNLNSNTIARNMGVFKEFCKYLSLQEINCYQIPNKIYPQNHHNYTL